MNLDENHSVVVTKLLYVLCSLQLSAQSEYHWNRGAGNVAHFCDHHCDEVR